MFPSKPQVTVNVELPSGNSFNLTTEQAFELWEGLGLLFDPPQEIEEVKEGPVSLDELIEWANNPFPSYGWERYTPGYSTGKLNLDGAGIPYYTGTSTTRGLCGEDDGLALDELEKLTYRLFGGKAK